MPFDQSTITGVNPPVYAGFSVSLSWVTTSPQGTWFQIYLNGALASWTTTTSARIALPSVGPYRIDIGAVLPGEEQLDFSSMLPAAPARRAQLTWQGGYFEGDDLAGFRVYGSPKAGGAIDYSRPLADIAANPAGIRTDGFGMGGFGAGGFGSAAGTYTWTSDALGSGTWQYAVVPYDSAGNEGTAALTSVALAVPPNPPAIDPEHDGARMWYTYDPATHVATLFWLASPP